MNPETEYPCPNCGEPVYEELFACPNCGLVLHPPDEDDSPPPAQSQPGFSIGAVLGGWVVSAVSAFLLSVLASRLFGQSSLLLFLAAPLGALAGGALAARLGPERALLHGLGVGAASIASAYLLAAVRVDLSSGAPPSTLLNWALTLAAGPLGAWLAANAAALPRLPALGGRREKSLYNTLLMRVRYDSGTAERLIDLERRRLPNGTRARWIENAIDRLDRDRR